LYGAKKANGDSMKMNLTFICAFVFCLAGNGVFAQHLFSSFEELCAFADTQNKTAQSGEIKLQQAQKAKLAAMAAIPDPVLSNSFYFTDNTQLPVNLFPAEAFGGNKGEYREVQTGVRYNTTISSNLDIKLLNLEAWQNVKLAKLNFKTAETDKRLNAKNLHENLATVYFNIVQLQAQKECTEQSLFVADTILQVAENKFREGIARQQDVNDARINQLNTAENARQIGFLIAQQYLTLKILADIPVNEEILVLEKPQNAAPFEQPTIRPNLLSLRNSVLQEQLARTSFKKSQYAFAPTLSFVANNTYNQYNPEFTVIGGNWINSQFVGLRLQYLLPTAATVANRSKTRFDLLLSQNNTEKAKIQTVLEQKKLATEWSKARSQQQNDAQVLGLHRDNFQKNRHLYDEGLQGIDRALTSFSAVLNAEYSLIASQVNIRLAQAKIDINNKFN
jgi:outer membrane protein